MKALSIFFFLAFLFSTNFGQSDLDKMVAAERDFAAAAAADGTKSAFLRFTAPDGILFLPAKIKTTDHWSARSNSPELLSWAPNYADISSNGVIGYTTGNWEYRAKGKGDVPSAFGEYVTIWQRTPDENYRFVLDIGISHEKPTAFSTSLMPASYPSDENAKRTSAADTANSFFEAASSRGMEKAYKAHAAEHIRGFREGKMPMIGKRRFMSEIGDPKGRTDFKKRSVFIGAADLAYITNTYTRTLDGNIVETGNFLQIWKLVNGRWQIVLDIFKPVPQQ